MALLDVFLDPGPLSPAVRPSFRREQVYELSMPVAIGLMEGGFIGVVAAKAFDAPAWVIAVTSAAPMFGNLSSFVWNRIAAGRPKVPMALALQAVVLLCVLAIALSPRNETGVWVLLVAVVTSRLCISGIVTVRSVAWSLNYERLVRARMIGRLQALSSLTFVVTTGLGALLLDGAAARELDGAAASVLQEVADGAQEIDSGGILEFALIGLVHKQGLVEFGDEAGDVGIVVGGGNDEDLVQTRVGDDLS